MNITVIDGNIELKKGLKSKPSAIALATLDSISNDSPSATPKNIFLPKVTSLEDPKMNIIASKIIAIRVIG